MLKMISIVKEDESTLTIAGYTYVWNEVDRDAESFNPKNASAGLENYNLIPLLTYHHPSWEAPRTVSMASEVQSDEVGIKCTYPISKVGRGELLETRMTAIEEIKAGLLRGFSGGFNTLHGQPVEYETTEINGVKCRMINNWELNHVALVEIPASPKSVLTIVKSWRGSMPDNEKTNDKKQEVDPEVKAKFAKLESDLAASVEANKAAIEASKAMQAQVDTLTKAIGELAKPQRAGEDPIPDAGNEKKYDLTIPMVDRFKNARDSFAKRLVANKDNPEYKAALTRRS